MGFRFILLFIAIVMIWLILRHLMSRKTISDKQKPAVEQKVRSCDFCGVHIPEKEGILSDEGFFCCSDHRQQYQKDNSLD